MDLQSLSNLWSGAGFFKLRSYTKLVLLLNQKATGINGGSVTMNSCDPPAPCPVKIASLSLAMVTPLQIFSTNISRDFIIDSIVPDGCREFKRLQLKRGFPAYGKWVYGWYKLTKTFFQFKHGDSPEFLRESIGDRDKIWYRRFVFDYCALIKNTQVFFPCLNLFPPSNQSLLIFNRPSSVPIHVPVCFWMRILKDNS